MLIKEAIKYATEKLQTAKIKNPRLEAEFLLSHILKKSREYILSYPEKKLIKIQVMRFELCVTQRLRGMPLAYIVGHKGFYGLDFKVNKNVLIPRPETELMVDNVLELITRNSQLKTQNSLVPEWAKLLIIDVGTGSGCIAISLAKQLKSYELRVPSYEIYATDISKPALMVAKQNSKSNKVYGQIKFFPGDLLEPVIDKLRVTSYELQVIITANLPYGWSAWKNNTSADTIGLKFEPQIALFTGKNGLELYEKLFNQITNIISISKYPNIPISLLCEFDPRQTAQLKKMIKKILPKSTTVIKKDLSGLDRLAIIKIQN